MAEYSQEEVDRINSENKMDLKMDQAKNDLVFINGECPVTVGLVDSATQRIVIRLRTFLGEWFINTSYGVPWLERVLGHKVNRSSVDIVIQESILQDDLVSQVVEFTSSLDEQTRKYKCQFRVRVIDGTLSEIINFSRGNI